jgi:hypothetical protein
MLDALREDGAKVVSFDITFEQPDQSVAPIRAPWAKLEADKKTGKPPDPKLAAQLFELAREFDADAQFAATLRRFGPVVLGDFYLLAQEIQGIDDATLDKYAALVPWYSLNRWPHDGPSRMYWKRCQE